MKAERNLRPGGPPDWGIPGTEGSLKASEKSTAVDQRAKQRQSCTKISASAQGTTAWALGRGPGRGAGALGVSSGERPRAGCTGTA